MAEDTTVRDELARDRTILANERTLLAYGRTAVALIALAVFVFRFSPTPIGITVGVLAIIMATGLMLWGWRNYRVVSSRLADGSARDSVDLDS